MSGIDVAQTRWTIRALDGGGFVYESHTRTVGVISMMREDSILERSEWRPVDDALQPFEYHYDRRRGDRRREVSVHFDWPAGKVRNTANGQEWEMPVPAGTLDKLSYLLVMMRDLGLGKRDLRYPIADGGTLKTYRWRVVGEEEVETSRGRLATLKVQRIRLPEERDRDTVLWCAEALGFLPVRIEHREVDGTLIELSLERVDETALVPAARALLLGQSR
jgi:hypothetical protein